MERIKESMEKAREEREQGVKGKLPSRLGDADSGSRLGKDRILGREPFKRYSSAEQQKLMESGRVVNVGMGETLQFAGDNDAYVHYLLSGAVVLESENDEKTVSADQQIAQLPLDGAGVKAHTIMAASDAEILRVPFDSLPNRVYLGDTNPIPTAAYTETFSGQQLATLVEQINSENDALDQDRDGGSIFDSGLPSGEDSAARSLDELSASADSVLADLEVTRDDAAPDNGDVGYIPSVNDELGRFTRTLERQFRAYVENVKQQERARYETQLQRHAERLQTLAKQQIREMLTKQREKYQVAYAEKEQSLRARFNKLRDFANKIARQKAAIYVARRQISEKLQMVEQIHSELSQLGSQLNHQLDDIDDLMPKKAGTGPD